MYKNKVYRSKYDPVIKDIELKRVYALSELGIRKEFIDSLRYGND